MIRWLIRTLSQDNIHLAVLNEIKSHGQNLDKPAIDKISGLITGYQNCHDQFFVNSIKEISDFPIFRPIVSQIYPRINQSIKQYELNDLVKLSQSLSKFDLVTKEFLDQVSARLIPHINQIDLHAAGTLLYSFSTLKDKSHNFFEVLSKHCLKLIEDADKVQLIKIFKSFSYFPETGFVRKGVSIFDNILNRLDQEEIVVLLDIIWRSKYENSSFEIWVFNNLKMLDNENFSMLINKLSKVAEKKDKMLKKITQSLEKREPQTFSSKAIMYTVNGLHELNYGHEVCTYFAKHLNENLENIENEHICLIMYVFGIREKGSRNMWRTFAGIVKNKYKTFTELEKIWAIYGLFKAGRLKEDLYTAIVSTMNSKEWEIKGIEKMTDVSSKFNDINTLKQIKNILIEKYAKFNPNKGLIIINELSKSGLMSKELYSILKFYKSKETPLNK